MNGGSNNVIDIDYIMCSLFDSVTLWGCALIRSTKHQSNIKHNNVTRFAMKKCTKWRKTRMYDSCRYKTDRRKIWSSLSIPLTDDTAPTVMSFILVPMKSFHPFSSHRSQTTKIQAYWGRGVWETMTDEFLSCSGTCLDTFFLTFRLARASPWRRERSSKNSVSTSWKNPVSPVISKNLDELNLSMHMFHHVPMQLFECIFNKKTCCWLNWPPPLRAVGHDWSSDGLKKSEEASLNTVLHTYNTQIIYIHTYVYTVEYTVYALHFIV